MNWQRTMSTLLFFQLLVSCEKPGITVSGPEFVAEIGGSDVSDLVVDLSGAVWLSRPSDRQAEGVYDLSFLRNSGAKVRLLYMGRIPSGSIVANETHVYFFDGKVIRRVAKQTALAEDFVRSIKGAVSALAVDDHSLFWVDRNAGNVSFVDLFGEHQPRLLSTTIPVDASRIAIDDRYVYLGDFWGHTVARIRREGGAMEIMEAGPVVIAQTQVTTLRHYSTDDKKCLPSPICLQRRRKNRLPGITSLWLRRSPKAPLLKLLYAEEWWGRPAFANQYIIWIDALSRIIGKSPILIAPMSDTTQRRTLVETESAEHLRYHAPYLYYVARAPHSQMYRLMRIRVPNARFPPEAKTAVSVQR